MEPELNNNDFLIRVYDLFGKFGIKSVTMDDISRELGISKKTLYQIVSDKADLVNKALFLKTDSYLELINNLEAQNLNAIDELFELNGIIAHMLRDQNPSLSYDLKKYYQAIAKEIEGRIVAKMLDALRRNIIKGKIDGLYRPDVNEELITKIYFSRFYVSGDQSVFSIEEIYDSKVFLEVFIYHIRGLANEKGRKYLEKKLIEINSKSNEN